jgi:hypothetical protein
MKILKWLGGLLLPMFNRPRLSPGLVWTLHLLLVAGVTVGLYFVHRHFELSRYVGGSLNWLRDFWLPALFLLAYFIIWQAWWLWKLWQPDSIASPFPDLDQAWDQIHEALEKAGIGIADTPLFLVFGRVTGAEETLFQGVPGGLTVTGGSSSGSPLRAFASREAVYITCPGASLLGNPVVSKELAPAYSTESVYAGGGGMDLAASIGLEKSIGMASIGGDIGRVQQIIRAAREENRSLSEGERDQIRRLSEAGASASNSKSEAKPAALMQDPAEVELRRARLAHACRLISRSRWPLCPVNGAIVYVPLDDCQREEVAQQVGLMAHDDLQTAEDSLQLEFPIYALLGRLETLPGAGEFLSKFAVDRKNQRLGKGYPLSPDLTPQGVTESVEAASTWIFNSLLPFWTLKLFAVERGGSSVESTRMNTELFHFLNAVRSRADAVGRLVSRLAAPKESGPLRFGGCYLTASAPQISASPLFAEEFFKKVESTQGSVAWTDEAFRQDAHYRSMTKMGYLALTVLVGAVLALGAYVGYTLSSKGR